MAINTKIRNLTDEIRDWTNSFYINHAGETYPINNPYIEI